MRTFENYSVYCESDMAKKMRGQETAASNPPKKVEATTEVSVAAGRYANHIQCTAGPEEFILDFFSRIADNAILTARVFITPAHAERLAILLNRQVALHRKAMRGGRRKMTFVNRGSK